MDTDVIAILAGIFFELSSMCADLDIWVGFGMSKHFKYYHMNSICQQLGEAKCRGLPFFHAFTGCDTTSQFSGRGKKSSWEAWKSYSTAAEAFQFVAEHPFQALTESSTVFETLERFTCILYDKSTAFSKVNELRQDLFSKKAKLMENIPPTQVCN